MPEAYLLAGLLPLAHPVIESTLAELPILTGEGLTHRYAYSKLPGKASGSAVLVRTAATNEDIPIHRQARERVQEALESRGVRQVVNIGSVIALLHRLREIASLGDRELWQVALHAALEWVDNDVLRKDLAQALRL
ncbi:hypothetical protein D3875_03845 [Deinococcus cavernae]|uniref:Uncharacterized protein n=2 Tax=Deinococcus cavernae TaxID=2320857 RepID=A0A418VE89_9DEIO|nr:hypothetical protein D3875_03845 [Deinococcus cavernae]